MFNERYVKVGILDPGTGFRIETYTRGVPTLTEGQVVGATQWDCEAREKFVGVKLFQDPDKQDDLLPFGQKVRIPEGPSISDSIKSRLDNSSILIR